MERHRVPFPRPYVNKDNADCAQDPLTLSLLSHCHRDLEALGDYLMGRHRQAIAAAGLAGKALCGEVPFHWKTDFDYPVFGGWKENQDGKTHERDILVVIPGKRRGEAIVLADHYDTAYMEDLYDKSGAGTGSGSRRPERTTIIRRRRRSSGPRRFF